ncbi:MAG: N-acetylmuramoyl-L-alanine amidase [Acidobacteriales bacterium]|nr:N-acetylmuramoyl-L-alanine amidase [Terriglobales bacterium]
MRSTDVRRLAALAVLAVLVAAVLPWVTRSAEEKRLYVFTPAGISSISITDQDRHEYIALQDLLPNLGQVGIRRERDVVRLRVGAVEGEFRDGRNRFRIGKMQVESALKVRIDESGRVLVPLDLLPEIIKQYTGAEPELRLASHKLYLRGVAQYVSIELRRTDPSTLVLTFPVAVSPNITNEGGRVRLSFTHEPVLMSADRIDYQDKLIQSIAFSEPNGASEITVQGAAPLLTGFSEGGRVITLSAAPAPPKIAQAPAQPPPSTSPIAAPVTPGRLPATASPGLPETPLPVHGVVPFFVMIDPGHGGDDSGARFSEKFQEKDVTLAIARRLRAELQDRGITAVLLRDSDTTLPLEQRAEGANLRRAGMFISLHAGGPGVGVRVYTALVPPADPKVREQAGPFIPWQSVHAAFLDKSRVLGEQMVSELAGRKVDAQLMPASIAPLSRVASPAVALEVAPPRDNPSLDGLNAPAYQQAVAQAAAAAVVGALAHMLEEHK